MLPLKPTFRGYILTGIAFIALCLSIIKPSIASSLLTSVCFSIVIASFILSWFSLSAIKISRDIIYDGIFDKEISLPLTIMNNTGNRSQAAVLQESFDFSVNNYNEWELSSLSPGEKITMERHVLAKKRGKFNLSKLILKGGDPAGLFKRIKTYEFPGELTVFPEIEQISSIDLKTKTRICSTVSTRPLGTSGQGEDIFGLREYRHGDPVRFVNWKASLRQKNIMVKEFEAQEINRISVILDVDSRYVGNDDYDNNFEYLIKTATSIIHYLSGMYCQTSFITYCDKKESLIFERGTGNNIVGNVDAFLSELQPSETSMEKLLESSLDLITENSILYCLTMSANEHLYKYFDRLSEKSIDIRWFFAPPECFPKIVKDRTLHEEDTSLFGYGMHSPTPFVIKRGLKLDDALTGN